VSTPRRGRGAHGASVQRVPVIVAVVVLLLVMGLLDRAVQPSPAPPPGENLAAVTAAVGAESSTWYCTGGSGPSGIASPTLYFVNAKNTPALGTLTVVNDSGSQASIAVDIPAGSEVTAEPGSLEGGTWIAARVDFQGGGVTVSQLVQGTAGWATSPCATTTSTNWYFASGSTANGSLLYISLYNPTATDAVVDLSFATPSGIQQPAPFEGLVVEPGHVLVAGVASYVQNQDSVSATVVARSGRVVATELQQYTGSTQSGLSLRLGVLGPAGRWAFPRSVDVTGGDTSFTIFNPTSAPEQVRAAMRIPSGAIAPFQQSVPADSAWILNTQTASRIPANADFTTTITATGAGVVVDRAVLASSAAAPPQWGAVPGVSGPTIAAPTRTWIVPTPQLPASPPVAGATPYALAVQNPESTPVTVTFTLITPNGLKSLAAMPTRSLGPGQFFVIEQPAFARAETFAVRVHATGGVAVMEDAVPAGMPGVVVMPGVPVGS